VATSVTLMQPDARGERLAGYRRSTGSARGLARRRELLSAVTDDVAAQGLVGFSLRRAAAAAGTTHKVLLYHFHDVDELLASVAAELRARRIGKGLTSALEHAGPSLADRVRAVWPVLVGSEQDALLQAIGLAIYDPQRYEGLVRGSAAEYLDALRAICPAEWADDRKTEIAELILATMRGLLLAQRIEADTHEVAAGLAALERALRHEEAADK
jgi:AcrR family transcriptional regulator